MLPPAIIFINADLNANATNTLKGQLYINDTMSFTEFNSRVKTDPNYPNNIHSQSLRILVLLPTLMDQTNRNLADVVLFFNQGQITIEKNNFGPPGLSLPIARVDVYTLLRYNGSSSVVILPKSPQRHQCCQCSHCHQCHHCLGGIVVDELADASGVYCPNPDNEYNNPDFINRK